MRGKVTPAIRIKARELLGINPLTTEELRLRPYLQYVVINEQPIDPARINDKELRIIRRWQDIGFLGTDLVKQTMSKKFWGAVHELIWMGYIDYD